MKGKPAPDHRFGVCLAVLALAGCVHFAGLAASTGDFLAGADASHAQFFENHGISYKESGQAEDIFQILKRKGLNCVRLRLFTSSAAQAQADPYDSINNLDYTIPLAVRVKQAGLRLLLDFHYSDSWADPGKQTKPAAWTNLAFADLEQRMFEYNRDCLSAFAAAGAMPDCVQIGNEITAGMLWPDGRVGGTYETPAQWAQLGRLLKAAIGGIRASASTNTPKILIHIDRGGDWAGTQWFFDNIRQQQVEFDVIGLSYYPWWDGGLDTLQGCLTNAAARYGKPVAVVETAFPWTNSASVAGIAATPAGQVAYVAGLAKILKGIPGAMGFGVFWWASEYQHLDGVGTAGFEFRSLFDSEGNVLPAAAVLGQLAAVVTLEPKVSGAGLMLTWPFSGAADSLMTAPDLTDRADWLQSTNQVEITNTGFWTLLPMTTNSARFFRLRSQ